MEVWEFQYRTGTLVSLSLLYNNNNNNNNNNKECKI